MKIARAATATAVVHETPRQAVRRIATELVDLAPTTTKLTLQTEERLKEFEAAAADIIMPPADSAEATVDHDFRKDSLDRYVDAKGAVARWCRIARSVSEPKRLPSGDLIPSASVLEDSTVRDELRRSAERILALLDDAEAAAARGVAAFQARHRNLVNAIERAMAEDAVTLHLIEALSSWWDEVNASGTMSPSPALFELERAIVSRSLYSKQFIGVNMFGDRKAWNVALAEVRAKRAA